MGWSGVVTGRVRRLVARRPRVAVAAAAGVTLAAAISAAAVLTPDASQAPARPAVAATVVPPAVRPTVTPTPTPTPTKPTGPLLSPFTGLPVPRLGPVLAVKIDNIVYARPQTGLRSADLVYVIPVEGGLTRYMAVFSSHVPPVVGPVRSARESDLDLLRQFGRPAFAWSGAAPHLVPFVERAPLASLYALRVGGYYRDDARIAPYNLFASTRTLLREAPKASPARDIGFRFGPLRPADLASGQQAASYSVKYPAASYTFRWSASQHRWLTWVDGAPARGGEGGQLGGSTVVVQYTQIATSRFIEYGGRPPYAKSTGSGKAVVLRDGKAYTVRWVRNSLDGGTAYYLPDGQRMQFARGQTWVVLAPDSHASYVNAGKV
jgi:Protein of unknown function (DUF3048) N-terminal domain/Protein of unknown function (DUF3048) C-terminal domain